MADNLSDLGFVPQADSLSDLGFAPEAASAPVEPAEPIELTTEEVKALQKRRAELRAAELAAEPGLEPSFMERYGEPTAAFLQGFSSAALPFVAGKVEELAGVAPEKQLALREEHPVASGLGTVGGIAAGVIATGGIGGAAEAAGANAAAAAAATGASRAAQIAAGAKAAAAVGSRAGVAGSAISPLAIAARVGAGAKAATTAALPVLGKTAAGRVAASTAGALAEGALISTALEADEARLEGREMHADAILHGALVSGGIGGVLTGVPAAVGAFGQTQIGQRIAQAAGDSAAVRTLKRFGATASEIARAKKQIGEKRYFAVLNDAERFGLVSPMMSIEKSAERATDMLTQAGEAIGAFAQEAAERSAEVPSLAPRTSDVLKRISDEVVSPLAKTVEGQRTATAIASRLQTIQGLYRDRIPVDALARIRTDISKTIYGLRGTKDPLLSRESAALRQMRNVLTDEISNGLEQAGIAPKAWRVVQRRYEVAQRIDDLTEQAQIRAQASTPLDVMNKLFAMSGLKWTLNAAESAALDWAPSALRRALESGAPKPMIRDLQELAEAHQEQLQTAATTTRAAAEAMRGSPEEIARRQYLRVYGQINAAEEALGATPEMQERQFNVYRNVLAKAKKALEDAYYGNIPKGTQLFHPAAASPQFVENAAQTLESVEAALAPYTRLAPGRTMLHQAASGELANVQAGIRNALATPGAWGAKYTDAAIERLNDAARVMVDEDRVAALGALEEMTRSLQSRTQTKADKLMGLAGRTAEKAAQTRDRDIKRGARKIYEVIGKKPVARPAEEVERQMEQERRDAAAAAAEAP